MIGITLDTGALIGLERGNENVRALIDQVLAEPEVAVHIPAGVLAQALRDPSRQVYLMRLLKKPQTRVVALDEPTAYAVGLLMGLRGACDVVDASVVVCARRYRQPVITSDPGDLRRLDSRVELHAI